MYVLNHRYDTKLDKYPLAWNFLEDIELYDTPEASARGLHPTSKYTDDMNYMRGALKGIPSIFGGR